MKKKFINGDMDPLNTGKRMLYRFTKCQMNTPIHQIFCNSYEEKSISSSAGELSLSLEYVEQLESLVIDDDFASCVQIRIFCYSLKFCDNNNWGSLLSKGGTDGSKPKFTEQHNNQPYPPAPMGHRVSNWVGNIENRFLVIGHPPVMP